ncbi:MAG: hypothetical protein HZB65_04340 [Candidatus Aenigmarchaeota archaeon]|nr:hypothetical protein [Candidatus Aenigmarchaeota archaeon]
MTKKKGMSWAVIIILIMGFGAGFLANDYLNNRLNISIPIEKSMPVNAGNFTTRYAEINVVAVTEDGKGLIGRANIELVSGKGRILVNTNPFIEADTQFSAEMAVSYAMNYTNIEFNEYDTIVSFNMSGTDSRGQVVGGPSAGAALTIAAIAVLENKRVRNDVAATGTIEPDGYVGHVGGVFEKAAASGEAGMKIFLVPEGQGKFVYYEKNVTIERRGPFQVRRVQYVPVNVDLSNYTMTEWNMATYEMTKVEDALAYVLE